MADTALRAVHELNRLGHLSEETDYEVRNALGLVSDEEKEAHKEDEKEEKAEAEKVTGARKETK